ncbi:unnamed protein product [Cuscuta campestris]|uniref:Uncharacterized protein n=1 Tax=Cuscuta campestris TaxID=132261 RepID=A0A484M383_9ASTE|nr:unnamed protein product [Cuscuta campestris]
MPEDLIKFSNMKIGELQRKKKRKINSPSTSGNVNPDELKEKEPAEETSTHNRSPQQFEEETPQDQQLKNEKIIKKCLSIPVNHNCEDILDDYWVWQRNPEDLHMEYLANTPVSDCEADDEDTAVFKPVFTRATEEQMALTSKEIAVLEATAEDFPIFPETSPAFEMVLTETIQEKAASPPQEQNQEANEEEEFLQLIQSQVLEILTTPCEISNQTQLEILEKSAEIPEQSAIPEPMEKEVEIQRHSGKFEKESQMAEVEVSQTPIAIFEEPNEAEDSDSLSRYISNFALDAAEGESERTLKLFNPTLPDEIPEIWTKKVQELIESALASQQASFRQEIEQMEAKYTQLLEKSEEKHSADLKEIALAVASANQVVIKDYLKVIIDNQKEAYKLFRLIGAHSGNRKMEVILQQHSPSPIPQLPIAVKEGEASYIPSHLNMTNLILEAQQRNPENSAQHLSSSGLDGTEFIVVEEARPSKEQQSQHECSSNIGLGKIYRAEIHTSVIVGSLFNNQLHSGF